MPDLHTLRAVCLCNDDCLGRDVVEFAFGVLALGHSEACVGEEGRGMRLKVRPGFGAAMTFLEPMILY